MTSKRTIPARSNFIVVGIVTLALVAATVLAVDPQRSDNEALVLSFFAAWLVAGAIVGRWGFLFAFLIWPLAVLITGVDEPAEDQPLWVLSAFSSLIFCLPLLTLGTLLRRLAAHFSKVSR